MKPHAAASTVTDVVSTSLDTSSFGLTPDQFANLLSHLGKQDNHPDSLHDDQLPHDSSVNLAGNCLISAASNSFWIVDSGATDHMCNNISYFTNCKDVSHLHNQITIPDGRKFLITTIGDIQLKITLHLHNVLYVPNSNLI